MKSLALGSSFERELGLLEQDDEKKDKVSYVPEEVTASDDIELIYEGITEGKIKRSFQLVKKGVSSLALLSIKFPSLDSWNFLPKVQEN